jgi:hypothetical protein
MCWTCVFEVCIYIEVKQKTVGDLDWPSQFFTHHHHHQHHDAEGVALGQQSYPFKAKTGPVPNNPPSSPCTSPGNNTCPRPKHESPVIRQNHVRRLQRR